MDEVSALLDEVRLLFTRAVQVVEQLHRDEPVTAGGRAVLELIQRSGPTSVSELARRRHVSRQHLQTLVNALLAGGLVSAGDNPAHRRSPLISLTPSGSRMIRRIRERERRFVAQLSVPDPNDLARARRTLAALRDAIGAAHGQPS